MKTRSERLDVRITREHKRLLERAALATGQPLTGFLLSSALERARETLEQESRTVLSERDAKAFLRLIAEDRAPAPALVRAARRHG